MNNWMQNLVSNLIASLLLLLVMIFWVFSHVRYVNKFLRFQLSCVLKRADGCHKAPKQVLDRCHQAFSCVLCCKMFGLLQVIRIPVFIAPFSNIAAAVTSDSIKPAISLTDNALSHLNKMRSERIEDLCLRIGVKQGGCSGMSYMMEFEDRSNMKPDDSVIEYDGFMIVCDPKSLLFIYGMQLDFSDALIGGGFSFKNPNATQTCGCGKSFAA